MSIRSHMRCPPGRQRGMSLLVSLIMLVALMLLVVSAIRMSNAHLRTVSNMQAQNEAAGAAQQAIEQIVGDVGNFYTPVAKTIAIDINGDGTADFTVSVSAPTCLRMAAVPGYSVDFSESAPKETFWDIRAVVTDGRTGASVTVHQGVKVRMASSATC